MKVTFGVTKLTHHKTCRAESILVPPEEVMLRCFEHKWKKLTGARDQEAELAVIIFIEYMFAFQYGVHQ